MITTKVDLNKIQVARHAFSANALESFRVTTIELMEKGRIFSVGQLLDNMKDCADHHEAMAIEENVK